MFWLLPIAAYFAFPGYLVLISQIMIIGLFALSLDLILGYAGIVSLGHAAFFGFGAYTAALFAKLVMPDPWVGMGVAKEVARINTPVSRYSKMRAIGNLRNWLAFLTLRQDPAAQWEIRQYANAVGSIVEQLFPRTWELYQSLKGYYLP